MKTLLLLSLAISSYAAQTVPDPGSSTEWAQRGNTLFKSKRYREAETTFRKALELATTREAADTTQLSVLNINLAAACRLQGRYSDAEPLYRKALEYAESDPAATSHIRGALRGLALVSVAQGRLAEAELFARRSFAAANRESDPTLFADGAITLSSILLTRGEFRESEAAANQALTAIPKEGWRLQKVSGLALNTLGRISLAQGKNDQAETYLAESAQILEGLFGREDPTVAAVSVNLAEARARRGDWQSAISLLNSSIPTLETILGRSHPEVSSALSTLGTLYKARKQYGKAKALYERALEIDENVFGPNSQKTAVDLNNLGSLAFAQRRFRDSVPLFTRALQVNRLILGANHPDTGLVSANLAEAYFFLKRYSEAELLFKQAIAVRELTAGLEDPRLGTLYSEYSYTLRANGRFSEAEIAEVRSTRIKVRNAIRSNS